MGRLKTLTVLVIFGAWGATADGAPQDDTAAPSPGQQSRPAPPAPPSEYVKAGVKLCKKGDMARAAKYLKAANDYRDMLSPQEQATLDEYSSLVQSPATDPGVVGAAGAAADDPGPASFVAPTREPSARDRAASLVAKARQELAAGRVEDARTSATEARSLNAPFAANEDNPAQVLAEIERGSAGSMASRAAVPNDAKQQGRWLLQSAREQARLGKYDEADKMVAQARALNVRWTLFDDTPNRVASTIEKARAENPAPVANAPAAANTASLMPPGFKGDRRQAKARLEEARALLNTGQFDQAMAIAQEVNTWGVSFGILGDSPSKVMAAARALKRRDQMRAVGPKNQGSEELYVAAVQQARQSLAAGKLNDAEQQARAAQRMNVVPSLTADRAESVLHDIAMTRVQTPPGGTPLVASNSPATTTGEAASAVAERQANELLAQGRQAEARSKFEDADRLRAQELGQPTTTIASTAPAQAPAALPDLDIRQAQAPTPVVDPPANLPATDEPPPAADPLAPQAAAAAPAPVQADSPAPLEGPAPAAPAQPPAPGVGTLARAREMLANGNFPESRRLAMAAKQEGAGLEADNLLAQIGQTEQEAAIRIYSSVLDSIRRGTERDMLHARGLLNELSAAELDDSMRQKVEALAAQLQAKEGPGRATVGSLADDKELVAAQKLNAEVGTKMAEARRLLETDPQKGIELLEATMAQVKVAGVSESATRTLVRRLEVTIELAKKDKVAFDGKMKEKKFREEIERKRLRILEAEKSKQERVADLMAKAQEASANGKHDEAEKYFKMVVEIDPNNIAATAGVSVERFKRHYKRDLDLRDAANESNVLAFQGASEVGIADPEVQQRGIKFDPTFKSLTASRAKLANELRRKKPPKTLEIEAALERPVTLNMDEKTTLEEAMKYLREVTGLNIIVDSAALAEESLTMNAPVQLKAKDIKLKTALKHILQPLKLNYLVDDEVLLITGPNASRVRTMVQVYNVGDLVLPPSGLDQPGQNPMQPQPAINPADLANMANDPEALQAQAVAMTSQGAANGPTFGKPFVDTGSRPKVDFAPLINLIKASVAPGTWSNNHNAADAEMGGAYGQGAAFGAGGGADAGVDQPIGSITPFYLSISLIIRHTPEVHDEIVDLLRQLRRLQDLQVSVEVRFINVSDSFFEQIGVDFDFSIQSDAIGKKSSFAVPNAGAGNLFPGQTTGTGGTTGGNNATTGVAPYLFNPIRDHALGNKQPLIVGHTGPSTGNGNPGDFTGDLQMPFTQGSAGSITPFNALSAATAATFGIAFLSDLEVYLFLTAVQGDTRSNIVQAPKVTTFNGAFASVSNFTNRNFVAQVIPIVGPGSVAFFPIVNSIPDGVVFTVTPVVSADRRYVRMTLAPFFNTFIQFDNFPIPAAVGGGGLGGQASTIQGQIQLPVNSFTNVNTTVTVPDGGTVLLGGVKRMQEQRVEIGVPLLSKTPWINRLFRNIGIGRETSSLMLMVTPRIIILEEEEERLGIPRVDNMTF